MVPNDGNSIMKEKFVTIAVILAVLGGVTAFNIYVRPSADSEEDLEAREQAEEKIEEGKVLAEELKEEGAAKAAETEATTPADAAAPASTGAYVPVYLAGWPEKAPDNFKLNFVTSKGDFVIEADKSWAPLGTERLYQLARESYFNEVRFFRVIPGFMAQFGLSGDPRANKYWDRKNLRDETVTQSNLRGYVTFARAGPNTRSTQLFINFGDNSRLDNSNGFGFPPIGKVIEGMGVVDQLYGGYNNPVPDQGQITRRGNAYLEENYPKLDYIVRVELIEPRPAEASKE